MIARIGPYARSNAARMNPLNRISSVIGTNNIYTSGAPPSMPPVRRKPRANNRVVTTHRVTITLIWAIGVNRQSRRNCNSSIGNPPGRTAPVALPYSAGNRAPAGWAVSNTLLANASSQVPVVEARLYSVARFSKKLACSTAFSMSSSQGSGLRSTS